MAGLMYKNFLLYRVELVFLAMLQAAISAIILMVCLTDTALPQGNLILYGSMFLMTGFFESGLFLPDEKPAARHFLMAAPCMSEGHIQSKYWFILLVNLGVTICCFVTDTIAFALTGNPDNMLSILLILLFSVSLVLEALSIPFIVYFGANYGVAVKGAALGVLVLLLVVYLLFGDLSFFLRYDFMTALEKMLEDGSAILWLSLFPYFAVGLYWLSCKLSVILFRRGAENYE